MKHYLENIDEVCRDVKTGVDGITSQEAESRLESNGKNKLAEGKKEPIILRLLKQFIEPMTLILIVAAIISGILTACARAQLPHHPEDALQREAADRNPQSTCPCMIQSLISS